MTKKKRELLDILLDTITPDDWPVEAKFAAQDKKSWGKNKLMFYKQDYPPFVKTGATIFSGNASGNVIALPELCCNWSKTIVHRDEFMKRWNECNSVVDPEGWIQWNGGEMPVEQGTLIDVKYRDGVQAIAIRAGCDHEPENENLRYAREWRDICGSSSIIAYRLHVPQEQKTPQQLALEKFGTDWHDNEGVQPVDDNVLIDAIVHGGALMRKYTWSALGLFKIKKWRVHSDEKESQASEKEKKLEWLSQPMPLFGEEIPCHFVDAKSPLETQIGGDHYTKLAIQPMQYSMKNKLDPLQHTVIKYVTRFRDKNGIEDLEKAKHCIDMLIEFERGKK